MALRYPNFFCLSSYKSAVIIMSEDNFKFSDTLNVEVVSLEFVDLSFYDSVLGAHSIRDMDYYMSRITNNPNLSRNVLTHDYNKVMYPKTSSHVTSLSETTVETGDREVIDNSYYSSRTRSSPVEHITLQNMVTKVVSVILNDYSEKRVWLLKMFAYMLCQSGASERVSHPILRRYINELRVHQNITFKMMHDYLGSAYAAKYSRDIIRKIFSSATDY